MSIVKSFSFPDGSIRGDMFYIKHGSKNFTVIDCYLKDGDDDSCRLDEIISEIKIESKGRICRFISTHPDNDHILGIDDLDDDWEILNFYAVDNDIPKDDDDNSLTRYIWLKENKNFKVHRGIRRAFLNQDSKNENREAIGSSGITFEWPVLTNEKFKKSLEKVGEGEKGKCVNNICPIIKYSIENGPVFMWMGDLETDMQQEYYNYCQEKNLDIPECDIFFQPHHGRKTGKTPKELLDAIKPKIIIVGNAPADKIEYGDASKTITQNTAGDILFKTKGKKVHIYTQFDVDNLPDCLDFDSEHCDDFDDMYYKGTLNV